MGSLKKSNKNRKIQMMEFKFDGCAKVKRGFKFQDDDGLIVKVLADKKPDKYGVFKVPCEILGEIDVGQDRVQVDINKQKAGMN